MTEKDKTRERILKLRKDAGKKTVASNSRKILKKLFRLREFRQAKKVMFYSSFGNEVETGRMIEKSLELKKQVFLPRIVKNRIVPARISAKGGFASGENNLKDLVLGKFGVWEPKVKKKNKRTINNLDVLIVPGVAFDSSCNRLGFGRGYFDKFLKMQRGTKIGLAHGFQVIKKIPVSKNDVPMDFVVTEKKVFKKRRN